MFVITDNIMKHPVQQIRLSTELNSRAYGY